jgi:hypothetical protein
LTIDTMFRPCGRTAAEQRDELAQAATEAADHSITSAVLWVLRCRQQGITGAKESPPNGTL